MLHQSLYHTYKRYRTLCTHKISALPIAILMPHSACNCRCVMCDIWKGNNNLKQLTESDITGLLSSFKKLGTKQIVLSGGEALLNPNLFQLCRILKKQDLHITLLSTGISIKKYAEQIIELIDDVIVSLDGNEEIHNQIRNIPFAYSKLAEGVQLLKFIDPSYQVTARTVIHRLNFMVWPLIVDCAKEIGLNQISFLPADVNSHAFNREILWDSTRQNEIMISKEELPQLKKTIDLLINEHADNFHSHFISESPEKINNIYLYYSALHGLNPFPFKKCNAPWVSTVIEPDGVVKPCFFHQVTGSIRNDSLIEVLNNTNSIEFRTKLANSGSEVCDKCVCYLNLPPSVNPARL
jgi:MoaA/NifB/PqqE/SkfB family radical SAM enzyme